MNHFSSVNTATWKSEQVLWKYEHSWVRNRPFGCFVFRFLRGMLVGERSIKQVCLVVLLFVVVMFVLMLVRMLLPRRTGSTTRARFWSRPRIWPMRWWWTRGSFWIRGCESYYHINGFSAIHICNLLTEPRPLTTGEGEATPKHAKHSGGTILLLQKKHD